MSLTELEELRHRLDESQRALRSALTRNALVEAENKKLREENRALKEK